QLGRNALHIADADSKLAGNFADPNAFLAQSNDGCTLLSVVVARPTETLALCLGALETGAHTLAAHRALKLGERAHHLEKGLGGRGRGVDPLLMALDF